MGVQIIIPEILNKRDHAKDGNLAKVYSTEQNKSVDPSNEKNSPNNEHVDFDDLLPHAGEFGIYQVFLCLSTMPFYLFGVFVFFSQMFITEAPTQFWCWIPELENLTASERRSFAIPPDETGRYGYSRCHSYVANWSHVLATGFKPDANVDVVPCQYGWEFDTSEIPYPTITTENGWVCDKGSYRATAQSIFSFGSIFGGFLIGWVADRYGRLPATAASNLIGCVCGVASIFARTFTEFTVCRFFMGMASDNCMMMVYLLVLEYIAPKYRTMLSNASFALFYTLGAVALPWIALACNNWKTFSLVTSLPLALAILAPFVMPESPRWLLSKGRIDDAIKKVTTMARINKKQVPPKLIEKFKHSMITSKEQGKSIFEILKRPLSRKMFILMCFEYMCCGIVFDALVRSIGQLEFDFFISFSIVSFTEFPSSLVVAFIMDWMGRRWLTAIFLSIACVFSFLVPFVGGGLPSVACAVVARFSTNVSYSCALQWGAEILPTAVRGSGLSLFHICVYVASMISPYIAYLETYIACLPLIVIGSVAGVGSVIATLLPETAKKDMPQTFDDAEDLFRNQTFWEKPWLQPKEKQYDDCYIEKY